MRSQLDCLQDDGYERIDTIHFHLSTTSLASRMWFVKLLSVAGGIAVLTSLFDLKATIRFVLFNTFFFLTYFILIF